MRVSSFWLSAALLVDISVVAEPKIEVMDLEQLIDQVDVFLQTHFASQNLGEQSAVEVHVGRLDPRLRLTACDQNLNFELRDSGSMGGNVSVHTRCQGSPPWALYVPAEVKVLRSIVVASRNLERGSNLQIVDFDTQLRDISSLSDNYVSDVSRLIGKTTTRTIRSGEVIRLSTVTEPVVVKRGDTVIIEAQSGAIVVSTQAIALADGRVGEQISVRNTQSERMVRVKIMGPGRGKVIF